jgi:hypothetical protein
MVHARADPVAPRILVSIAIELNQDDDVRIVAHIPQPPEDRFHPAMEVVVTIKIEQEGPRRGDGGGDSDVVYLGFSVRVAGTGNVKRDSIGNGMG